MEWVEENLSRGRGRGRGRKTGRRRRGWGGDERMDVRREVGEREVWLNSGLFISPSSPTLSLSSGSLQGSLSSPTKNL
jgi:hypothetical protein